MTTLTIHKNTHHSIVSDDLTVTVSCSTSTGPTITIDGERFSGAKAISLDRALRALLDLIDNDPELQF